MERNLDGNKIAIVEVIKKATNYESSPTLMIRHLAAPILHIIAKAVSSRDNQQYPR